MHSSIFVIFFLGALCIKTSFAESTCEIKSGSGRIFDSLKLNGGNTVEKCWIIKVAAETKAIIEVTELTISHTWFSKAELTIGDHLLVNSLENKFQTLGWKDTRVVFHVKARVYETQAEFELSFNVVSLACDELDAFRCSESECVPKSKVWNGVDDCSNGADEKDCGTTATPTDDTEGIEVEDIKGMKESRENTLRLLSNLRFRNGGWREDTPRALTAIHLANGTNFDENVYLQLTASYLQLQIFKAISFGDPSLSLLETYITALVAICVKPKKFHGHNLLERLNNKLNTSSNDYNNRAYLAKCISGEMLSEYEIAEVLHDLEELSSQQFPKDWDIMYYAAMTIGCASRRGNNVDALTLDVVSEEIMKDQRVDGSFNRDVLMTAIYVQILMAINRTDDMNWSYETAVKYLMSEMDKSKGFESLLFTLPVLGGRTMADVRCNGSWKKGLDELTMKDVKELIPWYKESDVKKGDVATKI